MLIRLYRDAVQWATQKFHDQTLYFGNSKWTVKCNLKKKVKGHIKLFWDAFFVFTAGSHSGRDGTAKLVFFWQKAKVSDVVKKLTTDVGIRSEGVRE